MRRCLPVFTLLATLGCGSNHGPEGTVVTPGPGITGLPGGPWAVNASHAAPVSGGTLLVDRDGFTAIAADPDRDRVYLVDLRSQRVTAEVALPVGDEPGRGAQDGGRRVHVAARRGGALVTIDLDTGAIVDRRYVCPSPRGVAYDAALDQLHVACQGGELVSLPASGGDAVRVLRPAHDLRDVIVDGDRLFVSRFKSAELLVIGPDGSTVKKVSPPDGSLRFQPSVAWRMQKLPYGGVAMLHQRSNPAQIAIGPAGYYSGNGGCSGAIVEGTISHVDPDKASPGYNPPGPLGIVVGQSDLAISRDGSLAVVVSIGSSWLAGRTGGAPPVRKQKLQVVPVDTLKPGNPCAQEENPGVEGEITAVAFANQNRIVVQSREPAHIQVLDGTLHPIFTVPLSADSRADTGVALFHMDSGFGISCASCHPEGMEDGRTWQFADIGTRRTQTVAGGVIATAPFHWDGDIEGLPELIHEVFESRMGAARPNPQQIASFAKWLDRIPAPPAMNVDAAAAERGRAIFGSAETGCTNCHTGSHLTNNNAYDVGTGGHFQVPSLVGIGARAPFLHTGCAPTLADRFNASCGGGDLHGVTSHLNTDQIADLVSYLESL
jgi:mono/diheme cytochrome c family protein